MVRIAMFSDVHGNPIALDAVLDDVEKVGGVDEYWVVGDLVALGPQPLEVLERLERIGAKTTRGNTDRYTTTIDRPPPSIDDVRADPGLAVRFAEVSASFAWTQGCLHAAGKLGAIDALVLERRLVLPDGTHLLAVHASPGNDDGHGIHAGLSDEDLARMMGEADCELIFAGHTHTHLDRSVDGARAVNLGSVSLPKPGDLRARWSLLDASSHGYTIEHRRVAYDVDAVLQMIEESRHPSRAWLSTFFRGEGAFFRT